MWGVTNFGVDTSCNDMSYFLSYFSYRQLFLFFFHFLQVAIVTRNHKVRSSFLKKNYRNNMCDHFFCCSEFLFILSEGYTNFCTLAFVITQWNEIIFLVTTLSLSRTSSSDDFCCGSRCQRQAANRTLTAARVHVETLRNKNESEYRT